LSVGPQVHELSFDAANYSADAIQRAAYRFSDRLDCLVSTEESSHRCEIRLRDPDVEAEETLSAFRNEVTDHVLRERIRKETEQVRTLILARAFSKTGLTDIQQP
jgi:His-Xaa-Ser system protein HxsD